MSVSAIQELAREHHVSDPADARFDCVMLWTVYSDGEMTTQKAGPHCWGRRSEHVIEAGDGLRRLADDGLFPAWAGGGGGNWFSYVVVQDGDVARRLRGMVVDEIRRRYAGDKA